ncbi:hypothetical protein ACWHA3_02245 [Streptomyces cyaneofuscatus]
MPTITIHWKCPCGASAEHRCPLNWKSNTQQDSAATQPKITALYAEHASPDSIRHEITKARTTRDQWEKHIDALDALLAYRLAQIAAGSWPATEGAR